MLKKLIDNNRYECPDCGSSDGLLHDPSDNHTYCFACKKYTEGVEEVTSNGKPTTNTSSNGQPDITDINKYPSLGITSRNISANVTSWFGVKLSLIHI